MATNSLGAIPFVVTMSHNIDLDKIQSTNKFLDNWYLQVLGNKARGDFNLGSTGNTYVAAPGGEGAIELSTKRTDPPLPLSELKASNPALIAPSLIDPNLHREYAEAYLQAGARIGDFFSSANKDILRDQSAFPALWLSDLQNGQLLFASQKPDGTLVNDASGAPDPFKAGYNYLLGELYVGLNKHNPPANSNNGDITYIEQFGLPASLSVWYTDEVGNLYRGIVDQNGNGLSIPGTSSFLKDDGSTNPDVNNASAFAETLETYYSQLQQKQLKPTDGDLYANPKGLYSGVPNAIVNPDYGQFYDYFKYLKGLAPATSPIRWSGQYNQQQAYRVNEVSFNGFAGQGEFAGYDQNASIHLSLNYDSYSGGKPPASLIQTADVVIPWFGIPQAPSLPGVNTTPPAANAYAVANSDRLPQQPSGGWSLEWDTAYKQKTFSSADGLVTLKPYQGTTEITVAGGSYQAQGLYSYYNQLFTYDNENRNLTPTSYDWQPSGDALLSFTPPENPGTFGWGTLTLDGDAGGAVLQIQHDGDQWQFQGNSSQLWNNITTGAEFKVPDGGNLPDGSSPIVKLKLPPNALTVAANLNFSTSVNPGPFVSTAAPITSFKVLYTPPNSNSNELVATLTLTDTWQANQLVNPNNFTYAATTAGILGANAGYYVRKEGSTDYTPYKTLANDTYGTVVGDFLSLINAGLLGATAPFTYNGQTLPIGELGKLDPSYQAPAGAVVPSPWFDKVNGPVAKDARFGALAWDSSLPADLKTPYNVWASLVNENAPSVYGFGLSDRFRNGYDIAFNLEKLDLSTLLPDQKEAIKLQKFIPNASRPQDALIPTNAKDANVNKLYPVFVEYQIGGFGQSSSYDFLPRYPSFGSSAPPPTPGPSPSPALAVEIQARKPKGLSRGRQLVEGNLLANVVLGSKKKDLIIGGLGADVLKGRGGGDRYRWQSAAESGPLPGSRDLITDFRAGRRGKPIDRLELRGLGQGLNFIGGDAFSSFAGEVRFQAGLLEADLTGDGKADFSVALQRKGGPVAKLWESNLLL